jgi:hypothetical protein
VTWDRFVGCISAAGFASGDAIVVGAWASSPLGRLVDVMWVRPDGRRLLLAPTEAAAAYIAGLYSFDEVAVVPVRGGWDGWATAVEAGPLRVRIVAGQRDARSWLFATRPAAVLRRPAWMRLEDAVARPMVGRLIGGATGVRAAGVAPGGRRECYGARDYRPATGAALQVDGVDAGAMHDLPAELGIGLSSFPTRPAVVHVITSIAQP